MARWVRTARLAEHMEIAERTLEKWRCAGGGPPYARVRGVVLYDLAAVDAWLAARVRTSTSDTTTPRDAA